jgi:hypothetical protein
VQAICVIVFRCIAPNPLILKPKKPVFSAKAAFFLINEDGTEVDPRHGTDPLTLYKGGSFDPVLGVFQFGLRVVV